MTDAIRATAIERYRSDPRFRALAITIAHRAKAEFGRIDPERAERDGMELAIQVAMMTMEAFYQEDGELAAQRQIADHFKALAEQALAISPTIRGAQFAGAWLDELRPPVPTPSGDRET